MGAPSRNGGDYAGNVNCVRRPISLELMGIVIFFGLRLYQCAGLGLPLLQGALKGKRLAEKLQTPLTLSAGMGAVGDALVVLLDVLSGDLPISLISAETPVWWEGLLASFYGGITEELLYRCFLCRFLCASLAK